MKCFVEDWNSSYLPVPNIVKRRLSLFTKEEQRKINEAKRMRGLLDLSAMMATQLGLPNAEPSVLAAMRWLPTQLTRPFSVELLLPVLLLALLRRRRTRRDLAMIPLLMRISRRFSREWILPSRPRLLSHLRRRERRRSNRAINNLLRRRTLRAEVLLLPAPLLKLARLSDHLLTWP